MDPDNRKMKSSTKKEQNMSLGVYSELLDISPFETDSLEVTDQIGSLIMLHYKNGANLSNHKVANVRGVVIDVVKNYIVCPGIHFPLPVKRNSLRPESNNELILSDETGVSYTLDMNRTEITPFYDSVYLRAFLHNDVFYLCTSKRLDPRSSRSRWYDYSPTFTDLYDEAKGPMRKDLYTEGAKESPFIYEFSLISSVLNLTNLSLPVDANYVRYDGISSMWNMDTSPFKEDEIGDINQSPVDLNLVDGIVKNTIMSLEEGNKFLYGGNHNVSAKDFYRRPCYGESVFLTEYLVDDSGKRKVSQIIHVISENRKYRDDLFVRESNIYHTFVMRQGTANLDMKTKEGAEAFSAVYLMINTSVMNYDKKTLEKTRFEDLVYLPTTPSNPSKSFLQDIIWTNLYFNISDYYKPYVFGCMERYRLDVRNLCDWLFGLSSLSDRESFTDKIVEMRVKDILKQASSRAVMSMKKKKSNKTLSQYTSENIEYLVDREKPDSLYKLIAEMRRRTETSSISLTSTGRYKYEGGSIKSLKPESLGMTTVGLIFGPVIGTVQAPAPSKPSLGPSKPSLGPSPLIGAIKPGTISGGLLPATNPTNAPLSWASLLEPSKK